LTQRNQDHAAGPDPPEVRSPDGRRTAPRSPAGTRAPAPAPPGHRRPGLRCPFDRTKAFRTVEATPASRPLPGSCRPRPIPTDPSLKASCLADIEGPRPVLPLPVLTIQPRRDPRPTLARLLIPGRHRSRPRTRIDKGLPHGLAAPGSKEKGLEPSPDPRPRARFSGSIPDTRTLEGVGRRRTTRSAAAAHPRPTTPLVRR
jgi:hypothetical protein